MTVKHMVDEVGRSSEGADLPVAGIESCNRFVSHVICIAMWELWYIDKLPYNKDTTGVSILPLLPATSAFTRGQSRPCYEVKIKGEGTGKRGDKA